MNFTAQNGIIFHDNNHLKTLITVLKSFCDTCTLTDITLISGALKIHIHRHILAAFTSFFSDFLTSDTSNCYIIINDINETILEKIVELIYYGRVSVHKNLANELYKTMEVLKLQHFQDLTAEHFEDIIVLTYANHTGVLLNNLLSSRVTSQLDVTFVSKNFDQINVHSFVISANSKYMLNIFLKHMGRKKPFIFVLQNVTKEHLEIVLEFCYKGSTCVAQEDLDAVYEVAHLLGVDQLCAEILRLNPQVSKLCGNGEIGNSEVISRIKTSHCMNLDQTSLYKNRLSNVAECEHLVDITLLVNQQSFNAHGVVLSEFSPYFRHLSKNLSTMKDSFVLMKDCDSKDIKSFIEYIYTGETEFFGRPADFCSAMKELIDFELLPICESKECQILSKVNTASNAQNNITNSELSEDVCNEDSKIVKEETTEPPVYLGEMDFVTEPHRESEKNVPLVEQLKCETDVVDTASDLFSEEENEFDDKLEDNLETKPPLSCQTCEQKFDTRKQLSQHLALHPDAKVMKCKFCGKGFDKRSQLTLHIRTHTGARPFQCGTCGRGFAAKSALVKHGHTHKKIKDKLFVCANCNKSFGRKEYLEEHIRTHTGDKPYECPTCHKKFVGRTGLNHHKKVHEGARSVVCEVCGKSFTRHALWTHMKTHDKVYKCMVCQKNFATNTALKVHVSGVHLGHRSHQCEVCGKGFVQKSHLVRHIKLHGANQNRQAFSCGKCSRTFVSEAKLTAHTQKAHSESGERPFSCSVCHKRFAGRSTAMYHQRRHTGERPHACESCGKTFVRPDALSQHVQTHTAKHVSYECAVCNKKCATKSALNKHANSHKTSEPGIPLPEPKPITCATCNQEFQSESLLAAHAFVHEDIKRYQCGVCSECFTCQESLEKHSAAHTSTSCTTNDLPGIYAFQVCEQTYSQVIHTYTSNTFAQSTEGQLESHQQFGVSVLSNSNACLIPDTPVAVVRRPYSITIDGNLCCNNEAPGEAVMHPVMHTEVVPVLHKLQSPTAIPAGTSDNGPLAMIAATVTNALTSQNSNGHLGTLQFNAGLP